ncbi:uncharacterized protein TrAFT101_002569 [Trichoderma asperellum]|uniref:uncharacterized protein n=1 Tax=Trichoderma asperellum TaxID=101201 RepID=UPI00332AECBB|nr:hypothetical protein TrAFT101_002569 [Trichoderma asperellum]
MLANQMISDFSQKASWVAQIPLNRLFLGSLYDVAWAGLRYRPASEEGGTPRAVPVDGVGFYTSYCS